MKLIVVGATGFVGTEVIRQALRNPAVTSVIALARKPVPLPKDSGPHIDPSKLQSVVLEDWISPYPESVMEHLKGANACIWLVHPVHNPSALSRKSSRVSNRTLAVTPSKSRGIDFAEVTKICSNYSINGLTNMAALANTPFRFVYTSGFLVERNESKDLSNLGPMADYFIMRVRVLLSSFVISSNTQVQGRVENALLDFAKQHAPDVQVTVSKPGAIDGPGREAATNAMVQTLFGRFGHVSRVQVSELAAAMIDQCMNGITKDPLLSDDLVEIGQRVIREEDYLR